jgi:5-methylcytosine-specific restriction endonuclease McrA
LVARRWPNRAAAREEQGSRNMHRVLVLNATYEPLNTVSMPRAVALLLAEKAELVEAAEAYLRSQHMSIPLPLVIRLVTFVRIPRILPMAVTRRGVLKRDNCICQYCGRLEPAADLTLDHVLPRSRGGRTSWENVVAACKPCNHRKGNRTPVEARMKLLRQPFRPRYLALIVLDMPPAWQKYL